jgi:hypothetical protein
MELNEAAKEAKREYQRKWRAANRDKVRQHNQNYWKKKAQENMKCADIQEAKEGEVWQPKN